MSLTLVHIYIITCVIFTFIFFIQLYLLWKLLCHATKQNKISFYCFKEKITALGFCIDYFLPAIFLFVSLFEYQSVYLFKL